MDLKETDSRVKRWLKKGLMLGYNRQYEESLRAFEKALEINPNNDSAWFNKGVSLGDLGCFEDALRAFEKALEINPNNPDALYDKGITLGNLGCFEDALKAFEKALEINPSDPKLWNSKGGTLGDLGRYEEALKDIDKAIEIDPNNAETWQNKGAVLGFLGCFERSLTASEKATEINPNNAEAWYNKGITLRNLGDFEKALEPLIKAYDLTKQFQRVNTILKPLKSLGEGDELRVIETAPTDKKWVRVALVQLNFELSFNKPPNEFGYKLVKKEQVKSKIFKALELASKNNANIICFPELCIDEEWINDVKNLYRDKIIVFGSFYRRAFNTCPVIIDGLVYYIQKITPSPHDESDTGTGRCMKSGKQIIIFQTKFGRLAVLICMDFLNSVHKIVYNPEIEKTEVDFIIVPSRNKAVELFQKRGDLVCQEDHLPYVLQINAVKIIEEKDAGGTCIIGMDHAGALHRYHEENWKPDDEIKYKLFEAKGEVIIVADLDISRKGAPVPATDFKMKNLLCSK